jgi:hypothetical protein
MIYMVYLRKTDGENSRVFEYVSCDRGILPPPASVNITHQGKAAMFSSVKKITLSFTGYPVLFICCDRVGNSCVFIFILTSFCTSIFILGSVNDNAAMPLLISTVASCISGIGP